MANECNGSYVRYVASNPDKFFELNHLRPSSDYEGHLSRFDPTWQT